MLVYITQYACPLPLFSERRREVFNFGKKRKHTGGGGGAVKRNAELMKKSENNAKTAQQDVPRISFVKKCYTLFDVSVMTR